MPRSRLLKMDDSSPTVISVTSLVRSIVVSGLDAGRIPVSKEKRRDRRGRQAGCPTGCPDGPLRLVPRPVTLTSRQTIPVLLGSTPLSSARDERSPGARRRSQPTDPPRRSPRASGGARTSGSPGGTGIADLDPGRWQSRPPASVSARRPGEVLPSCPIGGGVCRAGWRSAEGRLFAGRQEVRAHLDGLASTGPDRPAPAATG